MSDLTNHWEKSAGHPHDETEVDAACRLEDPGGRHEDPAPDDTAHDDSAAIEEGQLSLHSGVNILSKDERIRPRALISVATSDLDCSKNRKGNVISDPSKINFNFSP